MFSAPDTLFIETREGMLTAKPLMDTVPAQPTNHQQHLLYAWRQKLMSALMHECVLIPEGVSDVAWLEVLQTALELGQNWQDAGDGTRLSTFVGIVPTIDAKIADTYGIVSAVHARASILVDGDNDGRGYFETVRNAVPPPRCVVFWPQGWTIEHVVAWIAIADETAMLGALGAALGAEFANRQALTDYLLTRKSYAPTHESVAITLLANSACRARAVELLDALCKVLRDPANAITPLFARLPADSTAAMHVFRFALP
jgi:putative ATP-dependent endonuclease of the OLD family